MLRNLYNLGGLLSFVRVITSKRKKSGPHRYKREKGQKDKVATQNRMYKCVFVGFNVQAYSALRKTLKENVCNFSFSSHNPSSSCLLRNVSIIKISYSYNIFSVLLEQT